MPLMHRHHLFPRPTTPSTFSLCFLCSTPSEACGFCVLALTFEQQDCLGIAVEGRSGLEHRSPVVSVVSARCENE
eukprot:2525819-Rhodomonas_salina.2